MPNRFLNNITINDEYTFPIEDGSADQVIATNGLGELSFVDQSGGTSGVLSITVKNISGGTLTAGTAVSVTNPSPTPPQGIVVEVIAADYDNFNDMPAIGILKQDLNNGAEGEAVMMGSVSHINTNSFNISDELYVGANGALVNSKPTTAGQFIQKIAVVVKKDSSNGVIKVLGAGRSNDVPLPLYIDNPNQRVGISEPSPSSKLEIVDDLSAASTVEYPLTLSVKDDNNSIDQQGGEGVGIKFKIAGNDTTDPGNSFVGAGIAAVREVTTDVDSSTGLAFSVSQNNETLDEVVRINHDGNVGILEPTPAHPLHITKNLTGLSESSSQLKIAYDSTFKLGISHRGYFFGPSNNDYRFYRDTDLQMIIAGFSGNSNYGYVGIGTNNPERDLHLKKETDGGQVRAEVNNTSNTANSHGVVSIYTGGDDAGDPFVHWKVNSNPGTDWSMGIDNSSSDKLKISKNFGPGTNDYLTITTAGLVGIGTPDPDQKLHVNNGFLKVQPPDISGTTPPSITISSLTNEYQSGMQSSGHLTMKSGSSSNFYWYKGSTSIMYYTDALYVNKLVDKDSTNYYLDPGNLTTSLKVAGNIEHSGLTMSSGTDVDQLKTVNMTFQLTANTWTDTGINYTDLSTGTYAVQVYVDDHNVNGNHYDEYYSGMMSWIGNSTTNSTMVDEIPLHRAGHAPNIGDIQLRTQRHSVSAGVHLMLQVKHSMTYTAALNNTDGRRMTFKFRRLI
jgi:hypothetical protein